MLDSAMKMSDLYSLQHVIKHTHNNKIITLQPSLLNIPGDTIKTHLDII